MMVQVKIFFFMILSGKVIKILANFFFVESLDGAVWECFVRSRAKKEGKEVLIGDEVIFEQISNNQGIITEVKNRRNKLIKPQVANIDLILIVFSSVKPELDLYNLDRYISYISYELFGSEIIICINKIDLKEITIDSIYDNTGIKTLYISARNKTGIDNLAQLLKNKNTLLTGPSGVGKSSIIKALIPNLKIEIGDLSSIDRGKHTTRNIELIKFRKNNDEGYIFDTPGFSKINFNGLDEKKILSTFPELLNLNCNYGNCLHLGEEGCMISEALKKGLSKSRFNSYINIINECREENIYKTKVESKSKYSGSKSKNIPKIEKKSREDSRRKQKQSIKELDSTFE